MENFCRWMYDVGIPFNMVNCSSFASMVEAFGQFGLGMKSPTYHEVRVTQFKKEVKNVKQVNMKSHEAEFAKNGCSIMCDG